MKPPTFDDVAEVILSQVNLDDFILQQTWTMEKTRVAREPGSDSWRHRLTPMRRFRLFLRTDKGFYEATGADLSAVVADAFAGMKMKSPLDTL